MKARRTIIIVCVSGLAACSAVVGAAAQIDFNREIRPILSEHCFKCHGPDENNREAGLRLDQRENALAAADSGTPAITPHRPDQSELIRRIDTPDRDQRMPPPS